jgi:hypothetical protein
MARTSRITGLVLAGLSALHVAWGLESSFPFSERGQLANAVVGTNDVPSRNSCFTVASLLALASAAVLKILPLPRTPRRVALTSLAGILALRAGLGLAGKTALLSPGSDSARFRRLDRQFYAPLCLGLALGVLKVRRRDNAFALIVTQGRRSNTGVAH